MPWYIQEPTEHPVELNAGSMGEEPEEEAILDWV